MTTKKLGQTESVGEAGTRDAFYVPAVLVCSQDTLNPGQYVRFTDQTMRHVRATEGEIAHGIADPFVPGEIEAGTYFWVLLRPGITHNLTHQFDILLPDLPVVPWIEDGLKPAIVIGTIATGSDNITFGSDALDDD